MSLLGLESGPLDYKSVYFLPLSSWGQPTAELKRCFSHGEIFSRDLCQLCDTVKSRGLLFPRCVDYSASGHYQQRDNSDQRAFIPSPSVRDPPVPVSRGPPLSPLVGDPNDGASVCSRPPKICPYLWYNISPWRNRMV